MYLINRRGALKNICFGIMTLILWPKRSESYGVARHTGVTPKHLFMHEGMIGFNILKGGDDIKAGDEILFCPDLRIDNFMESTLKTGSLIHLSDCSYEFNFRPVERFYNNLHKTCYHYIVETTPGLRYFHFNWTQKYDNYLKIGKWYRGTGSLSNCDNPSKYNPFIPATAIKNVYRRGELAAIFIDQNKKIRSTSQRPNLWDDMVFCVKLK